MWVDLVRITLSPLLSKLIRKRICQWQVLGRSKARCLLMELPVDPSITNQLKLVTLLKTTILKLFWLLNWGASKWASRWPISLLIAPCTRKMLPNSLTPTIGNNATLLLECKWDLFLHLEKPTTLEIVLLTRLWEQSKTWETLWKRIMSALYMLEVTPASAAAEVLDSSYMGVTLSVIRLQKTVERLTMPTNVCRSSMRPKSTPLLLRLDGEQIRDKTLTDYKLWLK
jgi:hypothetical protein